MKTVSWPPRLKNGRWDMDSGAAATTTLVLQTLGDLRANPYNPVGLSLGDMTFRVQGVVRARVQDSLRRLRKIMSIQGISESNTPDGLKTITVNFIDRETRSPGSATING